MLKEILQENGSTDLDKGMKSTGNGQLIKAGFWYKLMVSGILTQVHIKVSPCGPGHIS